MFTGIIECIGRVEAILPERDNLRVVIVSPISGELKIDQSVSHNGICLTVEALKDKSHTVTAVAETILKSDIARWQEGQNVNLERCMQLNGRLDGHIVQGHVDGIGICSNIVDEEGSWRYRFQYPSSARHLLVDKGSIAVSGVSLTVIDPTDDYFEVAIIPYTYEHTIFKQLKIGDAVNLEYDIIGKYVARRLQLK